ncbi:MAG: hypothetical protein DMF12_03330 [Verrucomicrobia bacterium]|nr:MAG: hypothetical protein DMF12_03330 [Verrucomicrobiota bacterium]
MGASDFPGLFQERHEHQRRLCRREIQTDCRQGRQNNVTIYHTIKGKRTEKKSANMEVASGTWHTLRVDFKGNHFTVTFDGRKAIEWDDDTFKNPGKVGVWTKADSVTAFDDFSYASK